MASPSLVQFSQPYVSRKIESFKFTDSTYEPKIKMLVNGHKIIYVVDAPLNPYKETKILVRIFLFFLRKKPSMLLIVCLLSTRDDFIHFKRFQVGPQSFFSHRSHACHFFEIFKNVKYINFRIQKTCGMLMHVCLFVSPRKAAFSYV